MSAKKRKPKTKAKTKLKAKPKPKKTKVKAKAKAKAKPKAKVKTKKKPKAKTKVKSKKTKSKAKPKAKPKAKAKSKAKAKVKTSKQALPQTRQTDDSKPYLTEEQKIKLLAIIKKIVDLHKYRLGGLKSLDHLDRILDEYNQKYTTHMEKFDAIVDFGIDEHLRYISDYGLIALKDNARDSVALYELLAEFGTGRKKFSEAEQQLNLIYEDALKEVP